MGPIIDAIWQLPWYKVLIIAVADDAIFLVKLWPLWGLIALIIVLLYLYGQWSDWKAKRAHKKTWAKAKKPTNDWEDHGTYYKRPGRGE